uniref:hypothetical protein n=1 Tax=Selenomonas sp. TaxID=2053611 RepID=UPI0025F4A57D
MNLLTNTQKNKLLIASLAIICLSSNSAFVYANNSSQEHMPTSHPTMFTSPKAQLPPGPPPNGKFTEMANSSGAASELKATKIITAANTQLSEQDFTNEKTDENALLIRQGSTFTLLCSKLTKTGDSSNADASNFTGQNAILLVNNSTATLNNLTLDSDADGANAIFATGKNAHITAQHIKIHTKKDSSRGLDATYGGTIQAEDIEICTEGAHCGALATDRGEGNVLVNGAKIQTAGEGSPCIYSTGNIQLTNGEGVASGSEIAVVEGKNSITLNNTTLTGHSKHGIMLYQSFSGDANVGVASFIAQNSTLNNNSPGPMFYITNTTAQASLTNTTLNQAGDILAKVTSDRWGNVGKNGGDFTLNAQQQTLKGQILANNISKVTVNLSEGSIFQGTLNPDNQAETASIHLAKDAVWQLTADAYV